MSLAGTLEIIINAQGIRIAGNVSKAATVGIEPIDTVLPVGQAGTLTTRTDNDTGVATLSTGHGIISTDKVDVFWTGGSRYNMTATVATNAVTVDGGSGDNLPAQDTVLVVTKPASFDATFDGDNLVLIGAGASQDTRLSFLDSGTATPITGNAVASVKASNASSTTTSNFKLTGLQYAA